MIKTNENEVISLIKSLHAKKGTTNGINYNLDTLIEVNVLISLLKIDCEFSHIIKALNQIIDIHDIGEESFVNIIQNIKGDEKLKDSLTSWIVIIPFEININRRSLIINGIHFKVISFNSLKKKFGLEYYQYFMGVLFETRRIENKKCKYLVVESKGRTLFNAWKEIEPSFDALRGIIDFVLLYNKWTANFVPQPRTKVPHPLAVFGVSTQSEFIKFQIPEYNVGTNKIIDRSKSLFKTIEKSIRSKPTTNSIQVLLNDVFRLYNLAMDEIHSHYCFLNFWQIIERIALSEEKSKMAHETIKKRIIYFPSLVINQNIEPYIETLIEKRNNLVHRGIDTITEEDINMVKLLCEKAILWILFNKSIIKTKSHLEIFYNSRDINNTNLKTMFEILAYIKKERNKSRKHS